MAHYGTAVLALNWMTALHERWLWRSQNAGEVVSGYGAGLIMLGVFIGARPYLREGSEKLIKAALPRDPIAKLGGAQIRKAYREAVERARPQVTQDFWAERVIAVAVVLLGTFLNGYGTPLARRWGFPV